MEGIDAIRGFQLHRAGPQICRLRSGLGLTAAHPLEMTGGRAADFAFSTLFGRHCQSCGARPRKARLLQKSRPALDVKQSDRAPAGPADTIQGQVDITSDAHADGKDSPSLSAGLTSSVLDLFLDRWRAGSAHRSAIWWPTGRSTVSDHRFRGLPPCGRVGGASQTRATIWPPGRGLITSGGAGARSDTTAREIAREMAVLSGDDRDSAMSTASWSR